MKKEYHIEEKTFRNGPKQELYSLFYIKEFRPMYLFPSIQFLPIGGPELRQVYNEWPYHNSEVFFETIEEAREWCNNMCKEVPEPRVVEIIKCESK